MLRLVVKGERIKQIYKQVVSDKETKKQRNKETNNVDSNLPVIQ